MRLHRNTVIEIGEGETPLAEALSHFPLVMYGDQPIDTGNPPARRHEWLVIGLYRIRQSMVMIIVTFVRSY